MGEATIDGCRAIQMPSATMYVDMTTASGKFHGMLKRPAVVSAMSAGSTPRLK